MTTRGQLKFRRRTVNLVFFVVFQLLIACLYATFFIDNARDECQADSRFQEMVSLCQVILFVACFYNLCILVSATFIVRALCRSCGRRRKQPPQLSSDEEDNVDYRNNLWVADKRLHSVYYISKEEETWNAHFKVSGSEGNAGARDGNIKKATFNSPESLFVYERSAI